MNYRLAYAIGFHPREDLAEHPPFAGKLLELVGSRGGRPQAALRSRARPRTGSAIWGVQLAKRGWRVTGVDIVEKALRRARERIDEADVDMRLVRGDVTALRQADVGSAFRLVLDTGTFHGARRRPARGDGPRGEPDRGSRRDRATRLLRAPAQRPLPRGASRAAVEAAFPGWEVTDVEIADTEADALARLFEFDERFHRLRSGSPRSMREADGSSSPCRPPSSQHIRQRPKSTTSCT